MKKLFFLQILLVISALLFSAKGAVQENPVEGLDPELSSLNKTCQVLIENPRDKEALQELLAYAKNTNGIDRLRSRAMAAYALSGLINGNTNLYVRARQSHARTYPDDKHLLRVNLSDCMEW